VIERAQLVTEARRWLDVPYVHQGRTRYGVDCIGLILCVRDALEPWDALRREPRNYARHPRDGMLLDRVRASCFLLARPEDGALILIRWPKTPEPSHVAIFAGGNIIHAYQRAKRVVETGFRAHWLRNAHSYWRLPGVA
jgi:cell wall-associated NlpC family hydrolase